VVCGIERGGDSYDAARAARVARRRAIGRFALFSGPAGNKFGKGYRVVLFGDLSKTRGRQASATPGTGDNSGLRDQGPTRFFRADKREIWARCRPHDKQIEVAWKGIFSIGARMEKIGNAFLAPAPRFAAGGDHTAAET